MASMEIKVENLKRKDAGDILRELSTEVVPILTNAAAEILEYPSEDETILRRIETKPNEV